jgi:hypothetical protein
MNNAVNMSGVLGLEIGKAPTTEQLSKLTENIVWMEERVVDGQSVLVPVVYLSSDYEYLKGANIVAQKGIDLNVKDSVTNTGNIKSNDYINLNARTITNNSGVILSNGKASLISTDDFRNKNGGIIKASDVQIASINGNIINETFAQTNKSQLGGNDDLTYTLLGKQSLIQSTNGNLVLQANNNIENIGSNLSASKTLSLNAINGDVNLKTLSLEDGHNFYSSNGFNKASDIEHLSSSANAESVVIKAGNDINLEAVKLNATNQINLNAANDVNITAVNDEHYKDVQTSSKGFMSKKTQRDMSYKEEVVSSELNANNIYITSGNDINLEAVNINAKNEKIAQAENSLNILAKTYKEGELHSTSKSSFGGLIKNEYKYEKDNLKIKSSQITANNMILDAKTINVEASKLKANQIEITTDILNMVSSKESLYENEFSNKGGILTATIETKGKIEEIVVPSTIEVNDKLIFNKKDITSQLESDNLVKILSSQGNLTDEQINLVKQIANSKEWHDKTTTLSGMGALIVTAVVTYFTAGAGLGVVGAATGTTVTAASATATQLAISAAIDAVIVQATTSLASSVITGNKLDLDLDSIAKSAVTAGVLSYAQGLVKVANLGLGETTQKIAQTVTDTTLKTGVQSVVFKTDFKDSLVSNLAMAGVDLLAKEVFYEVGNTSMEKSVVYENELYKDGGLVKTLLHSATGAGIAAINDEDILAGALSAGARELISPLSENYSKEGQLLASQLAGILVGGIVDGEAGAKSGMNIATAGELYNRQLHQDEIKFINENAQKFADDKGISLQDAKSRLAQQGLRQVDGVWNTVLGKEDIEAKNFLEINSDKFKKDEDYYNPTVNANTAITNPDIYKNAQDKAKAVLSDTDALKQALKDKLQNTLDELPQALNDKIDEMSKETLEDMLLARPNDIAQTIIAAGVGYEISEDIKNTPNETLDKIYGEGTGSTLKDNGTTIATTGAGVVFIDKVLNKVFKDKNNKLITKADIQAELDNLPNGLGKNYHVREKSDGNFEVVRNEGSSKTLDAVANGENTPLQVTKDGNLYTPNAVASDHGNILGNQPADVYKRYDADGNYLKTGISQDANTRYTKDEISGGKVEVETTVSRTEAAKIERIEVETNPGPLNKEPWAGKKDPTHPNYDPNYISPYDKP